MAAGKCRAGVEVEVVVGVVLRGGGVCACLWLQLAARDEQAAAAEQQLMARAGEVQQLRQHLAHLEAVLEASAEELRNVTEELQVSRGLRQAMQVRGHTREQ